MVMVRLARFAGFMIAITGMQVLLPCFAKGQILLFEDVTTNSGINIPGVTHSVSWGDFNNDGCPDLWVSKHNGTGGDGKPANLYQNLCNGQFIEVTDQIVGDLSGSPDLHGPAWADFNNDGNVDLMVLAGGEGGFGTDVTKLRAHLFVNSGGKMVDLAPEFGIDYPLARGRMPLWLDYDNDGKLDLFFGAEHRTDGQSPPTIFHQRDVFEDARSVTGFNLQSSGYAVISDLNGDRKVELIAIAPERFINIFDTRGLPFGDLTGQFLSNITDFSELAIADFNNDLRPDIYITRGSTTVANQLLINNGLSFIDESVAAGISGLHIAGNAVVAADFDNDGDQDLYIDQAAINKLENRKNIFLENRGDGTFVAIPDDNGPTDTLVGRGGCMAVADYDNDGFLDIVVANGQFMRNPPVGSDVKVQLLHNRGNANHWLKLKLIGSSSNRDAIGASVIITTSGISQLREANNGVHRYAQDDTVIHFGVAGATVVDEVMVRWPSGRDTVLNNVAADQVLPIIEPPS